MVVVIVGLSGVESGVKGVGAAAEMWMTARGWPKRRRRLGTEGHLVLLASTMRSMAV